MSEGERTFVDDAGDLRYLVRDGAPVEEPAWESARVVVTDGRLVLATGDGRRSFDHASLQFGDADALPDGVPAPDGTLLAADGTVFDLDVPDAKNFPQSLRRARLHDIVIMARPRAVVGGVVNEDADWRKARFRFVDAGPAMGFADGSTVQIPLDDVGGVDRGRATVAGDERAVTTVEYSDADGRSVETHLAAPSAHADALADLLTEAVADAATDHELSETERQVLVALYSGVSPFEMSDFVGIDVDEVERIYQTLLEVGAVDEVRTRTEVALNATGRNLASEAMSEE